MIMIFIKSSVDGCIGIQKTQTLTIIRCSLFKQIVIDKTTWCRTTPTILKLRGHPPPTTQPTIVFFSFNLLTPSLRVTFPKRLSPRPHKELKKNQILITYLITTTGVCRCRLSQRQVQVFLYHYWSVAHCGYCIATVATGYQFSLVSIVRNVITIPARFSNFETSKFEIGTCARVLARCSLARLSVSGARRRHAPVGASFTNRVAGAQTRRAGHRGLPGRLIHAFNPQSGDLHSGPQPPAWYCYRNAQCAIFYTLKCYQQYT